MKPNYVTNLDDIDEMDSKEFASSDGGCLKLILSCIIAILLTAVLLWLGGCKSYKQPKYSYEKIQTTIPNRG